MAYDYIFKFTLGTFELDVYLHGHLFSTELSIF